MSCNTLGAPSIRWQAGLFHRRSGRCPRGKNYLAAVARFHVLMQVSNVDTAAETLPNSGLAFGGASLKIAGMYLLITPQRTHVHILRPIACSMWNVKAWQD